jgi:hypothetical protein
MPEPRRQRQRAAALLYDGKRRHMSEETKLGDRRGLQLGVRDLLRKSLVYARRQQQLEIMWRGRLQLPVSLRVWAATAIWL